MAIHAQRPLRATERLRAARQARGLSHRQIADVTKVSTRVIAALEEERLDVVPTGVYRRSLVRQVAREVGLEPEATLREFLADHPDDMPEPGSGSMAAADQPTHRARAGLRRVLAMLGAAVPLLIGVAYFSGPRGTVPPVADLVSPSPDASDWRPEIVPAGGFSEAPPPPVRPVNMLITISERCTVEILADGGRIIGRTFEPGESIRVAFSEAVELYGSNAGAVQYSLNGRAGRRLGEDGEPLTARIGRDDYPVLLSVR